MGLLRRIAGLFGLQRKEEAAVGPNHRKGCGMNRGKGGRRVSSGARPRGAFAGKASAVQVHAAVERPSLDPVLVSCNPDAGGIQGFKWYTRKLRIDQDGDVADEFLCETTTETTPTESEINPPKFQVTYYTRRTRPTTMAMKNQVIVDKGNIRQRLEYQGKLLWV